MLHNRYQHPGGEDRTAESEERLLGASGHNVVRYDRSNTDIQHFNILQKMLLPATTLWSQNSYREVREAVLQEKPEVAHFHNTFPLISPAAYLACRSAGVPVVQTLHNYRLLCPTADFLRAGKPCESCVGKSVPWPGVLHACYRDSRAATSTVAAMLTLHRVLGTWTKMVDVYIAQSKFAKEKFIEGGLPAAKIVIKPNFVEPDPGTDWNRADYVVYAGRLSREKGVGTLLAAWKQLGNRIPLLIFGDGPLRREFEDQANRLGLSRVQFKGFVGHDAVVDAMKRAKFLVAPSACYENFPTAIIEAFACGTPVITARFGAMREMIADQQTGLHFFPSSPEDLAAKVDWAWTHLREMDAMGRAGRNEYLAKYTGAANLQKLMAIYERAIELRGERRPGVGIQQ